MWFFIPISFVSIFIGKKLNSKKNYVIAFICMPILIIFGSYRFIFKNISYDTKKIQSIERKIDIDLPNNVKIATTNMDKYYVSYAKITDKDEKINFENEIKYDEFWETKYNTAIYSLLPYNIQIETKDFDYFMFYNLITNEYNLYPSTHQNLCVFIAYECKTQRLIILDDYQIVL